MLSRWMSIASWPSQSSDANNSASATSSSVQPEHLSTAIEDALRRLTINEMSESPVSDSTEPSDEEFAEIYQNSVPVVDDDCAQSSVYESITAQPVPKEPSLQASFPKAVNISVPTFAQSNQQTTLNDFPLEPCVIAHDRQTQNLFDTNNIPWPTQWMLASQAEKYTWQEICNNIHKFVGGESKAGNVTAIMNNTTPRPEVNTIWDEYQREQQAIVENVGRGCGLMGLWQGARDWHGGNIQQLIAVEKKKNSNELSFRLQHPEQRRTHRIARYFGSRRIIILRVGNMKIDEKTIQQFCRKFIVLGRVFIPFHAKEKSIYLIETNENWERTPNLDIGDQYRLSFIKFREIFNPIKNNSKQPVSKWSTRWAIMLSNAIPALEFEKENIFYIDDIHAEGTDRTMKVPAHQVMTDGAGLINLAALIAIKHKFGHEAVCAAVQGRIGGSKGLWILHPDDKSQEPRIWIRDSQVKIKLLDYDHKIHRIFDFLASSKPSTWCQLSTQSILNLSYNGVPSSVLTKLMRDAINLEVAPLMDWNKLNAMLFLCDVVGKAGGVSGIRTQRQARGESRALGLRDRDFKDDIDDADIRESTNAAILSTGRNPHSGAPISIHEAAYELLQAGFCPQSCKVLWDKLRDIVKLSLDSALGKYKIPVDGVHAYVIPDPLGILEEGEAYYHSSKPMVDPVTHEHRFNFVGPVLIGRYPIRLPSDIQKVNAVTCTQLHQWMDVIILSTKGARSPASWLSGGDYDGDDLFMISEPDIVNGFTNSDLAPEPADFMNANFDRSVEGVEDFIQRTSRLSAKEEAKQWQRQFILGLGTTPVGIYSKYQEVSIYTNGYDHPESVRLGYMFNTLLDAGKTGLRLKKGIQQTDSQNYDRELPVCMSTPMAGDEYNINSSYRSQASAIRKDSSKPFILDELYREGKGVKEVQMKNFEDTAPTEGNMNWEENQDPVLQSPYQHACLLAAHIPQFRDELLLIEQHVKGARAIWKQATKTDRSLKKTPGNSNNLYIAAVQQFANDVPGIRYTTNLDEIKASYAYKLDEKKKNFAFNVAFRDLCLIKAKASSGGIAPALRLFDEMKSFSSSGMRALGRNEGIV